MKQFETSASFFYWVDVSLGLGIIDYVFKNFSLIQVHLSLSVAQIPKYVFVLSNSSF